MKASEIYSDINDTWTKGHEFERLKKTSPKTLYIFQNGEKYECYGQDADIIHKLSGAHMHRVSDSRLTQVTAIRKEKLDDTITELKRLGADVRIVHLIECTGED
jgi:DNA mismatch repair ATPase MutS